jgi:PAS domain S-box-containing protein
MDVAAVTMTKRLDAEQVLQALEGAGLAYWEWDLNEGQTRYSARWESLLGFPLAELSRSHPTWDLLLHPDDRIVAMQALQEHLERRASDYRCEARFKTASGDYKWILIKARVAAYGLSDGSQLLVGTLTDISKRKIGELALQKSTALIAGVQALQQRFIQKPDLAALGDEILGTLLQCSGSTCGFLAEMGLGGDGAPRLQTFASTHSVHLPGANAIAAIQAAGNGCCDDVLASLSRDFCRNPQCAPIVIPSAIEGASGNNAFLGVPICDGTTVIGMIGLGARPEGYDDATIDLIQPLVSTLGVMIKSARTERARAAHSDELIRASTQAIEAEERLREITNGLPGVVFQFEFRDSRRERLPYFNFVSRGIARLTKLPANVLTVAPRKFLRQVFPKDRRKLMFALLRCRQSQAPIQLAFRLCGNDGTVRWVEATANRRDSATTSRVWNGFLFDVTERKQADLELQKAKDSADAANRAKGNFLATVSHEIRTPLNGALGLIEMLKLSHLDRQQLSNVQLIEESSRSLLRLIDDLLDFSRMERGALEIRREQTLLHEKLARIADFWQESARHKGLSLTLKIKPGVPAVTMVDKMRLKQILDNLLSNAIKFTTKGSIELIVELADDASATSETPRVHFRVIDTGIGVPAAVQARLFQPFVQADEDTTRKFGGTGLGLSICRSLAERMGGTISMHSVIGEGTEMTLALPLQVLDVVQSTPYLISPVVNDDVPAEPAASPQHAPQRAPLILVAEDHAVNRVLMEQQLARLGYGTRFAVDGKQALALWREHHFDLVLTDCHMPEMDGFELARAIRDEERRHGLPPIPIVACTADVYAGIVEACTGSGMSAWVGKPITLEVLRSALEKWLGRPAPSAAKAASTSGAPVVAESSPPPLSQPLIDRARLRALTTNNEALADFLLQAFVKSLPDDLAQIRIALDNGDAEALQRAAHRLLGSARSACARRVAAQAEALQTRARAGDLAAARPLCTDLDTLVAETCREIATPETA